MQNDDFPRDWYGSPIIIVGAGRSGTSLLEGLLESHPDCAMIGETLFFAEKLFEAILETPEYVHERRLGMTLQASRSEWTATPWPEFWRGTLAETLAAYGASVDDVLAEEDSRLARLVGALVADVALPSGGRRRRWGFKEIWNGSRTFPYGWDLYEKAFPCARYVQSIRHPLSYLESYFALMEREPTEDRVLHAAASWVEMVEHSRRLAGTGRYFEYRLEDLSGDGGATLTSLFRFLDLDLTPDCRAAMERRYGPSTARRGMIHLTADQVARVPGLGATMEALGYRLDGTVTAPPPASRAILPAVVPAAKHPSTGIVTRIELGEPLVMPKPATGLRALLRHLRRWGRDLLGHVPPRVGAAAGVAGLAALALVLGYAEMSLYRGLRNLLPGPILHDEELVTMLVGWGLVAEAARRVLRLTRSGGLLSDGDVGDIGACVTLSIAGLLLMSPGMITDVVGVILLLPWVRQHVGRISGSAASALMRVPARG